MISYLAHGLKGIIQFWIKTADKVWQTRLTEELKISQFLLARNATDRCGK